MYYKITQLTLTPGQNATTTSEVFVAQVDAKKEELAGKLFVLIEIDSKKIENLKLINFLIDTINHNYYQNEKMILRERVASIKIEHIFETALVKTNKQIAEFVSNEKLKINVRDINATIGIIHDGKLHFVTIGKNKAFLIYKKTQEDKSTKYKLADLFANNKKNEKEDSKPSVEKLFSNIISGNLPEENYFVLSNEALPEYLSNKQMIDIITKLPPNSAIEQIKNTLSSINAYISFLGIIIKNTTRDVTTDLPITKIETKPANSSVETLNNTENNTEKLLSPSGVINFNNWFIFNKIKAKMSNLFGSAIKTKDNQIILKDKIFVGKKSLWQKLLNSSKFLKDLVIYLVNTIVYLFRLLTNFEQLKEAVKNFRYNLDNLVNKIANWFRSLGKLQLVAILVVIVSILLFSANLVYTRHRNQQLAAEQKYIDLMKLIEKKQNQIDASLLYSNDNRAKELFDDVDNLLSQLPQEKEEEKNKYDEYNEKYNEQIEKLRRVVRPENTNELVNYRELNQNATPDELIFAPKNNKIYASDPSQKTIYSLELENNLVTAITDLNTDLSGLSSPAIDNKNNVYWLNNNAVTKLSTEEELIKLPIDLFQGAEGLTRVANYNDRLYFLDKVNNQIFRFNIIGNNLTNPIKWLSSRVDFGQAVDIAIDGYIYVLTNDAKVMKFLRGEIQDFKIETVDPALEQPSIIKVSQEDKYLYILEPKKNRLLVFDKSGQFLSQYLDENFNKLKDFVVDEINKKIYILNDSIVYALEATHIEGEDE